MLFSIATPVFNGLPWIACCAASVRDQATNEISVEHLVHDGGSTDGTVEWLKSSKGIQWESAPDEGMYDAVNRCWRQARGEICAYLNADEQYLPGALAKVQSYFLKNPCVDIIFGDAVLADQQCHPFSYRRMVRPNAIHTRVVHLGVMSCSMFFRRHLLDEGFYFDPTWRAIGDAEWLYRLLQRPVHIGMLREPLAAFVHTGANLGSNSAALAEAAKWRSSAPLWCRLFAPAFKVAHYLQKALAGAYHKRRMDVALYTPSNPQERKLMRNCLLGSAWQPR